LNLRRASAQLRGLSRHLPRWLNAEVIPHRRPTGPLAIPGDGDGVADGVCFRARISTEISYVPGSRSSWPAAGFGVRSSRAGTASDHFRAISISSRAGQSTCRRSTWRSEPGCTEATVSGGFDPDHVNGSSIGCASAVAFSASSSRRTSVTITTTSSAVSFLNPFATRSRTDAASNPPAVRMTT
jgi:hypothetical protein